jgi:hypothetical protein
MMGKIELNGQSNRDLITFGQELDFFFKGRAFFSLIGYALVIMAVDTKQKMGKLFWD